MSTDFVPSSTPDNLDSPEQQKHNGVVVVTGVTCSGKDFLLDKVFEDSSVEGITHLGMGTLIGEFHSMNRDEMLGILRPDQIRDGQVYALNKLLDNTPAVLSTHIAALYEGEYVIGKELEMGTNPMHYVLVTAEPEQIRKWRIKRNKKKGRNSLVESIEEIDFHQSLLRAVTQVISEQHGSDFTVIYNTPEDTDENVKGIGDIVRKLKEDT